MNFSTAESPLLSLVCCGIPLLTVVVGLGVFSLRFRYWYYDRWLTSSTAYKIDSDKKRRNILGAFVIFSALVLILSLFLRLSFTHIFFTLSVAGIICFLAIAYVVYVPMFRGTGTLDNWKILAEQTGLTVEPSSFFKSAAMVGDYRGRPLHLTISDNKVCVTLLINNQADIQLLLNAGGVLSAVTKLMEIQAIQMGDERFDRLFLVKGQPEQEIVNILASSGLRTRLAKLSWQGSIKIEIANQQLYCEHPAHIHIVDDVRYLQNLFYLLSDLAEAVEQAAVSI